MSRIDRRLNQIRNIGARSFATYFSRKCFRKLFSLECAGTTYHLTSRESKYPIICRTRTSDILVYEQIFVNREYRCLDDVKDARLIIDCGANVGMSAAFFLSRHPNTHLIAVEPDPANFAQLEANLRGFADRVTLLRAAVWNHCDSLELEALQDRVNNEWAVKVRPAQGNRGDRVDAIDILSLISRFPDQRVDILKVDIEGAEAQVFDATAQNWLKRVDNLVIELHGRAAKQAFYTSVSWEAWDISQCDELVVCRRCRDSESTDA